MQTRLRSLFSAEFTAHFHPAAAPSPAPLDTTNEFAERLTGLAASMVRARG